MMSREEMEALIAQRIYEHELRIGLISGTVGLLFFVALLASLAFLYKMAAS
jgi:hypothetical protein